MSYAAESGTDHATVLLVSAARQGAASVEQWHYTNAPADLVVGGVAYRAAAIARDALVRSDEDPGGTCTLTLAIDTPLAAVLIAEGLGRRPLSLRVREVHAARGRRAAVPAERGRRAAVRGGRRSPAPCRRSPPRARRCASRRARSSPRSSARCCA
jgi:hypothetical protein